MEQPENPTKQPPRTPSETPEPIPTPAEPVTHDDPGTQDAASIPVTPDDLAAVRELILLAHPDIVLELVQGATIAELQAAVAPARAAYRQVAERIAGGPSAAPARSATSRGWPPQRGPRAPSARAARRRPPGTAHR